MCSVRCRDRQADHHLYWHGDNRGDGRLNVAGIDLSSAVVVEARRLVPFAKIFEGSALDMKGVLDRQYDIVIGNGVIGVFDFHELKRYVEELIAAAKPGGRVFMMEPYNQHGMDLVAAHRKRINGTPGEWERGNSIYSLETVQELFAPRAKQFKFYDFEIDIDLPRHKDPQRTWTVPFVPASANSLMDLICQR